MFADILIENVTHAEGSGVDWATVEVWSDTLDDQNDTILVPVTKYDPAPPPVNWGHGHVLSVYALIVTGKTHKILSCGALNVAFGEAACWESICFKGCLIMNNFLSYIQIGPSQGVFKTALLPVISLDFSVDKCTTK